VAWTTGVRAAHSDVSDATSQSPDLDAGSAPAHLFEIGSGLRPTRRADHGQRLHDHGLPSSRYWDGRAGAPNGRSSSTLGRETLERGDLDALFDFRNRAPGMPYATDGRAFARSRRPGPPPEPGEAPRFTIRATGLPASAPSRSLKSVGLGRPRTDSCFRPPAPWARRRPATRHRTGWP